MLRIATVSPLLLLLAQRARQRLVTTPGDPWQGMGGLRRESMDPDRRLDRWSLSWPDASQASLEQAWAHPLLRGHATTATQPLTLAQSLVADPVLTSVGRWVGDAHVLPWHLDQGRYAPGVVDHACADRAAHKQVWLAVSPADAETSASDELVQNGLRLGLSWFLIPPCHDDDTVAFERALRAWTRVIIQNPNHDQWVGTWCDLVERIFVDLAQAGQVSRRIAGPEGWPRCPGARWCAWARVVLDAWRELWSGPAQLEDICLGLLQPTLPPLAER